MHPVSRRKDWVFVSVPSKSPQTLLSSLRSDEEALVDISYLPLIGAIVEMRLVPLPRLPSHGTSDSNFNRHN